MATGTKKFSSFALATALNPTDMLIGYQSGIDTRWSGDILQSTFATYRVVPTTKYTANPSTTSVILMSNTSDFFVGLPVRYKYNATYYYGQCTAITANTSITIAGAALAPASALTELAVGQYGHLSIVTFFVSSTYGNGSGDLIAADMNTYFKWIGPKSYLATFSCVHKVADTGALGATAQPKINVKINGSNVSTNDSNNGVQLSLTPGTWTDNSAVAVDVALYDVNYGEAIEINCTVGGQVGDATNLTVMCVFVAA